MKDTMRSIAVAALLASVALPGAAPAGGDVERGKYLSEIMDCQGCHSGRTEDGAIDPDRHLTGGDIGFEVPGLGVFWPSNLTPHATGLGDWTDEQIIAAIREGVRPDGRVLAPIMPWQSYAALSDEDARDLVAYLGSLPPTENRVPDPVGDLADAAAPHFRLSVPE